MRRLKLTRVFIPIFFILYAAHPDVYAESAQSSSEKISLRVGGQKQILVKDAFRLNISRRGLLHIIEDQTGAWHVTGLRSGMVVLEAFIKGGSKKTFYIEVLPKSTEDKNQLNLNLSKNIMTTSDKILYNISASIELIEQSSSNSIGGKSKNSVEFNLMKPSIEAQVLSSLEARQSDVSKKVLASPTFTLVEGSEATMKSGGESIHNLEDAEGKSSSVWHEYGMNLTLRVNALDNGFAYGDILFSLKAPSSEHANYSLNQIQTSSKLKLNNKTLIGTVDLASEDDRKTSDVFWSAIPIIGPLFKHNIKSTAKASVQLWLKIKKLEI